MLLSLGQMTGGVCYIHNPSANKSATQVSLTVDGYTPASIAFATSIPQASSSTAAGGQFTVPFGYSLTVTNLNTSAVSSLTYALYEYLEVS